MRNIIISCLTITALLIILLSSFTQNMYSEDDCAILHKGTFKYGNTTEDVKVVIDENHHTEYYNGGKYIIQSDLTWVNSCEYNITMIKITIPDFPYKVGDIMNVKINKIEKNEIFYTSTVKGQSWSGKLIKIK
jgi:hypothetical protein